MKKRIIKGQSDPAAPVECWLEENDGTIDVIVGGFYIVGITEEGTLVRYTGVDDERTGLRLGKDGAIIVAKRSQ